MLLKVTTALLLSTASALTPTHQPSSTSPRSSLTQSRPSLHNHAAAGAQDVLVAAKHTAVAESKLKG